MTLFGLTDLQSSAEPACGRSGGGHVEEQSVHDTSGLVFLAGHRHCCARFCILGQAAFKEVAGNEVDGLCTKDFRVRTSTLGHDERQALIGGVRDNVGEKRGRAREEVVNTRMLHQSMSTACIKKEGQDKVTGHGQSQAAAAVLPRV